MLKQFLVETTNVMLLKLAAYTSCFLVLVSCYLLLLPLLLQLCGCTYFCRSFLFKVKCTHTKCYKENIRCILDQASGREVHKLQLTFWARQHTLILIPSGHDMPALVQKQTNGKQGKIGCCKHAIVLLRGMHCYPSPSLLHVHPKK